MVSSRLFHKDGPMYNKVFCPVLVLRKGCLSFAKLFRVYSTRRSEFKDFIQIKRAVFIDKLESYCIYALVNSFFSRQRIYRYYPQEIYTEFYLRQNHIYLFCIICVFFFVFFSVRFGYQAVQA